MRCEVVKAGSAAAIVCGRGGRRKVERCDECGRVDVVALCDFPLEVSRPRKGAKQKTCSRKLCPLHRHRGGEDLDYCTLHRDGGPPLLAVQERELVRGRRPLDKYYTPEWMTGALLLKFPQIAGRVLFDPFCGDGRMVRRLQRRFEVVITNDLDTEVAADYHLDAALPSLWGKLRPRLAGRPADPKKHCWVVTNPAFDVAGRAAWLALEHVENVALLVRCTFGEPCGDSPRFPRAGRRWLTRRPPTAILMMPRDSYTGDGQTDTAPTWWFIWSPHITGIYCVDEKFGGGQLELLGSVLTGDDP